MSKLGRGAWWGGAHKEKNVMLNILYLHSKIDLVSPTALGPPSPSRENFYTRAYVWTSTTSKLTNLEMSFIWSLKIPKIWRFYFGFLSESRFNCKTLYITYNNIQGKCMRSLKSSVIETKGHAYAYLLLSMNSFCFVFSLEKELAH